MYWLGIAVSGQSLLYGDELMRRLYTLQLVFEINTHLDLLRRDARVRVKQWLEKLRQVTSAVCICSLSCMPVLSPNQSHSH